VLDGEVLVARVDFRSSGVSVGRLESDTKASYPLRIPLIGASAHTGNPADVVWGEEAAVVVQFQASSAKTELNLSCLRVLSVLKKFEYEMGAL
jgi:hypothetical protein